MSATISKPLAETVYEIVSGDHGGTEAVDRCGREPASYKGSLSIRESDLRDWGFVYGLAFATARAEQPDEPEALIADRAQDAARAVFRRWCDEITPRPEFSPLVDAVLLAFEDCEAELDRMRFINGEVHLSGLVEALNQLRNGIGSPSKGTGL